MSDQPLAEELLALELELLSPRVRASAERLSEILADDFVEFGSSGRIFDKSAIISLLTRTDSPEDYRVTDFRLLMSAKHEALAIYTCEARSDAGELLRKSYRSSLWVRREGRWRMIFNQGTRAE